MFTPDKETLCNMHGDVSYNLRELRKSLKKKSKFLNTSFADELNLITNMLSTVKKAKSSGQAMENSLVRYRRAIESLNYRRFYKGKVQPKI